MIPMSNSNDWAGPTDCVGPADRIDDSSTILRVAAIQCFAPKNTLTVAPAVLRHRWD